MLNELLYKILLVFVVVLYGAIRGYYELNYQHVIHTKTYNRKRERLMVMLVGLCFLVPGAAYVFTNLLAFASFRLPDWVRIAGLSVMMLNLLFFWWVHRSLGKNWSPMLEIRHKQTLITHGPYKYIRHPMYTSIFIHTFSLWVVSANYMAGIFALCSFLLAYVMRVKNEEKMMLDEFGEHYRNYMKQTGRLIPRLF